MAWFRELNKFKNLLAEKGSSALRALNNGSNGAIGQSQPMQRAMTAAVGQQAASTKRYPPDQSAQVADRAYLRDLAKEGKLNQLMDDDFMLRQLGLSKDDVRTVLQNPNNHGFTGLTLIKGLLYSQPPNSEPRTVGLNGSAAARTPPPPPPRDQPIKPPSPSSYRPPASTTQPSQPQTNSYPPGPSFNGSQQGPPQNSVQNSAQRPPVSGFRPGTPPSPSPSPPTGMPTGIPSTRPSSAAAPSMQPPKGVPSPQSPPHAAPSSNTSQNIEESAAAAAGRTSIRDLLNQQRIFLTNYAPGEYRTKCSKCSGGNSGEKSLSVTIGENSKSAVWNCFRATCGFTGATHVDKPSAVVNSQGFFVSTTARKRKVEAPIRPSVTLEPLTAEMVEFFAARGISEETLKRNGVSSELVYDPYLKKENRVIAFPYYRDGVLVNVKYRTLDKRFWQVKGAEKVLYGLDDIAGQPEVVIVEGEMDKLALEEAGMRNVVSVPDGAPARVKEGSLPPASEDTKYSYLWNCRAWLDQAVRVVIATDNDAPGDALAEELARRLGRERCWRVRWPLTKHDYEYAARSKNIPLPPEFLLPDDDVSSSTAVSSDLSTSSTTTSSPSLVGNGSEFDFTSGVEGSAASTPGIDLESEIEGTLTSSTDLSSASDGAPLSVDSKWYRKDANEVLMRDGAGLLSAFVQTAEPLPIRGLLRFHEYYDDIIKHYYLELKDGQGVSTGWGSVDKYYKVVPGELTIVTGVPNSGKSEWIDALLANLSEMHGWTFAMCSMEKRATDHARQLAEKFVGRPFFDLPYARGVKRMTFDELDAAMDWVDDRFHLIRYEDEQLPSVDWVLEIAKAAVYRYGIRGLVIDPYNELDHQRPSSMSETEYVSQMLTKVKRFAQTAGVHVWFVAHPKQLREWKGQAPNLYDISGSAHFINKADNGIVVHRNRDPNSQSAAQVEILVRKVRNKAAGTIGDCVLEYERINGRYLDMENHPRRPPRTSERVQWKSGAEEQGSASPLMGQQGAAFMHRDGTISAEPESFF